MIYGLLHRRIKEKVPRGVVKTFNDLLKECRLAEETFNDYFENKDTDPSKPRIKCSFCKYTGHTEADCRRKEKSTSED